uniref:Transmembrane protein n=1 Tax=Kalanchoe fedtschenkoi TaxID=63787 RepID=A0A7N0V651_KALFE
MNYVRLVFSICLIALLFLSQTHLNFADEPALPSPGNDLAHPLEHGKNVPVAEPSFGSLRKLKISSKRRARGSGVVGGRASGSSAAPPVVPSSVHVASALVASMLFSLFFI